MHTMNANEIPNWLRQYPQEYLCLMRQNIVRFAPWYLLDVQLTRLRNEGLKKRYPDRRLFAFAARFDNDDIACWEEARPDRVLILHDFASADFANKKEFPSFWDWFRWAIEEMIAVENCTNRRQ
jgi:hypothetical protein